MELNLRNADFTFAGLTVRGDVTASGAVRLLLLHGAGKSHRGGYRIWREELLARGVGSAAFDCIGHGATGGELIGSSLAQRTEQALRFVEAAGLERPLVVVGSSMDAYTAIQLTRHLDVAGLVLNVPAVYAEEAYSVPFGPDFSRLIRRERSWERSDAWAILRRYAGDVLVVSAELDDVIPAGVIQGILDSAVSACSRRHIRLKGVGHRYTLEEGRRRLVLDAVAALTLAGPVDAAPGESFP